ncbi:MAG: hypothetical protein ABUL71_03805 [Gemmatimonadota bacterium]
MRRLALGLALCLALACDHSDTFVGVVPTVGPATTANDLTLTFNTEQDYWPAWTQDGAGILYSFVLPGSTAHHRCLGLLPAAGGTRIWELCNNRASNNDSATSYAAYALRSDGMLLYSEVVAPLFAGLSPPRGQLTPSRHTLWLADTATPYQRTALLQLPVNLNGTNVNWLSDLAWTGPTTFVALGQEFGVTAPSTPPCNVSQDSNFVMTSVVVRGTISGNSATLQPVDGTLGATSFSLAENSATVAFTVKRDRRLYKVPFTGGSPVVVATISPFASSLQLGVSCKHSTCLVASGVAASAFDGGGTPCPGVANGQQELRSVSLAGPVDQVSTVAFTNGLGFNIIVTPQISPVTGDVVVGVGGNLGHLQTIRAPSNANLHLLKGLVP